MIKYKCKTVGVIRKVDELRNVIANQFAYEYKAYDLEGVCSANGIETDSERDTM